MSITTVTPENVDQYGRFTIVTRTIDNTGAVTNVSRVPIAPGTWSAGVWSATSMAGQNAVISAFASQVWTSDAVAAFKAAFPADAPDGL